ncbi:MAG: cell division protein SepF [Lachnospiraceae bacterium]|nr:cell division protein SepF [Lachnospiraceae bacterium]MDD3615854.1 cell division protein SepF [Lachnospiraceae bacterium]
MGVLDKFLDAIKLNDDDYDDDEFFDEEDFDEFDEEEVEEKPRKRFFKKLDDEDFDEPDEEPEPVRKAPVKQAKPAKQPKQPKPVRESKKNSKVTPMRNSRKSTGASMEVIVVKPTSMEDTREIADALIDRCTVVLNLEGIDVEIAQRIIDFTSGSCYSIDGNLQKISSFIFILTPSNVDISGDYQDILNGAFELPSIRTEF